MKVSPSLLAADFSKIAEQIAVVERGGADELHLDVMDGQFVPNITWGPKIIADLRPLTKLTFDAHLMIVDPERWIEEFAKAGCDAVTFHYEATYHAHRVVGQIRAAGMKAGVALNPATPVGALDDLIEELDRVLVMSVNPGFGGQAFIPGAIKKVREARALIEAHGSRAQIEIDGGIGRKNVAEVVAAGVDIVVAGSSVFNAADPEAEIGELRRIAGDARIGAHL